MSELSSSDLVTYCVEDPEDQVVPDYTSFLCSSVSSDFKTAVLLYNSLVAISEDVCLKTSTTLKKAN